MMRRIAVTVALVGLVIALRAGAADAFDVKCFVCSCEDDEVTPATGCFSSDPVDKCPACPPGSKRLIELSPEPCNLHPECLALFKPSPAPALSSVGLGGLGTLLLGGGIWVTRKRRS